MKKPALPKMKLPEVDFNALLEEFKTLDPKDPGLWPLFPRVVTLAGLMVVLLLSAWWFGWNPQFEELDTKATEETRLKDEWLDKKKQAVNREEYSKQLVEIDRSFGALLRQLPNKAEMESMLIDINQSMVAKTFRYLDEAEVSKQKREKAAAMSKGAAPAKGDKK